VLLVTLNIYHMPISKITLSFCSFLTEYKTTKSYLVQSLLGNVSTVARLVSKELFDRYKAICWLGDLSYVKVHK